MPSLPKEISDFMQKYGVTSDEVWPVPGGKSFAIKHKAIERVAAGAGIKFERPTILEVSLEKKLAAMVVVGSLGDREEWATGEASPNNCKNAYTLAMAEKRAKDRVVLKLLQAHGALYSEDEADDFKQPRKNPHVTEPSDILPATEYDEQGQPIDNIPNSDDQVDRLPKAKARNDFDAARKEMEATVTIKQLEDWGKRNATRIATFPVDWAEMFRGLYAEHRDELRNGKVAA
jgi:hypothetical protein